MAFHSTIPDGAVVDCVVFLCVRCCIVQMWHVNKETLLSLMEQLQNITGVVMVVYRLTQSDTDTMVFEGL